MGAKKQENEMVAAFGSAAEAVKGLANVLGQLPADKFPEINEEQNIIPSMEAVETEQPVGAFEIAPGMTVEQIKSEFFNDDALQEQPETVYRLDSSGHRYYYTFDEDGEPRFYVSVTTLIKQTLPTAPSLIKWIADTGYEESQRYAAERASYGTFMHSQITELIINRKYDLNKLRERLVQYIETEQLPSDFINYTDDFKKDLLAFAQFMKDVELKPLAIELVLTNPEDGYAGAIDLAAEITIEEKGFFGEVYKTGANAGQPKETKQKRRIRAIIDFKSGRKGFFPEHEVQLHAYMKMWNMHFEAYPVEKVFNWSPKNFTGDIPTYNFKDQTDSKNAKKLPYLVELARIEDEKRDNHVVYCKGVIDIDNSDITTNIIKLNLSEVVKRRFQKIEKSMEEVTNEIWEDVKGYEGLYQVSSKGQVKSMYFHSQKGKGNNLKENPKILTPGVDSYGYNIVSLCNGETKKTVTVHKLVAEAFIPNPNGLPCINHKDENKLNNCIENLEWCTVEYNNSYGTKGERVSQTLKKKVYQYDQEMNLINIYDGAIDAEKQTGVSRSNICICLKGKTKTAGGFIWKEQPETTQKEDETANEAENKPAVAKTIRKRTITTKETKKPENEPKKAKTVKKAPEKEQKTEKILSKKDLLNNAIDI